MSERIDSPRVLTALEMALAHQGRPTNLLIHSDGEVQYASAEYRSAPARAGLVASMGRRGNCCDNAVMESFWSSLKLELIYRHDFASQHQARAAIFDYIESFYNLRRIHAP